MKKIEFTNFKIIAGRIDVAIITCESQPVSVWFELEEGILPSNDAIALSVSTLAGNAYDEIFIDLAITQKTSENIEKFTCAKVHAPVLEDKEAICVKGDRVILNFSGGFDSLAALYLMPKSTELVAVDFGGWFERERVFFEKFRPHVLRTNFRQHGFDKNSWTFMGVGALLYCEALEAGYQVFGTIMEATPYQFMENPIAANLNRTYPFFYAGLKDIRYTNGLTEVGTAMVVSYYAPEMANASLVSLSAPGTEKRFRKELLLDIVCKKYGRKVAFEKTKAPSGKVPFGTNLALDFLSIYILKYRGVETALYTVSDIPEAAFELADRLELNFYERINCDYISGNTFSDNTARAEFLSKLLLAGVLPYTENDYKEFREVADFLNQYHHFYKR